MNFWALLSIWFVASIAVPVFLPMIVMGIACAALNNRLLHPFQILKDGQLLWFATALSSVGMAEAILTEIHQHAGWNIVSGVCLFVVLCSCLFTLGCAALLEPKPLPEGNPFRLIWSVHMLRVSFLLTLFTIIVCTVVHGRLPNA